MSTVVETFLALPQVKAMGLTEPQIAFAKMLITNCEDAYSQAIGHAIEIVEKWGEVTQLADRADFKILIATLEKAKTE